MNEQEVKQATEKVIAEMLTESTGKDFMDSGDAYGRHWEENRKNGIMTGYQICDFYRDDEEKTCELIPTIPIFDAFKCSLEYNDKCRYIESQIPQMQSYDTLYWIKEEVEQGIAYEKLKRLIIKRDISTISIDYIGDNIQLLGSTLNYAYNLLNHLHQTHFKENTDEGTEISNSYNSEDFLSQVYMSIFFEYDDDVYVAISIHNGCDVRGGYTDTHIFTCEKGEFLNTHWDTEIGCLHTDGKIHICENGFQMYGRESYYSHELQDDVDEHYIYEHTYVDENDQLRCKECDGLITSSAIQYI